MSAEASEPSSTSVVPTLPDPIVGFGNVPASDPPAAEPLRTKPCSVVSAMSLPVSAFSPTFGLVTAFDLSWAVPTLFRGIVIAA